MPMTNVGSDSSERPGVDQAHVSDAPPMRAGLERC